jgi:SAM-dependent methyltransferase
MDLAKQIDRLHYALTRPGDFLRLVHAGLSNGWHGWTREWGPKRVECIVCGFEGRRFDYFLERSFVAKDSQCPNCGAQTRNRALLRAVEQTFELKGKSVLDVAPHPLYRKWFEDKGANYLSIDLGERPAMVRMDLTRAAFADRSFDLVICSHVLEHVPDFGAALAEIRRALRPDGVALIDVPRSNRPSSILNEPPDHQGHVHLFGRDFPALLEAAGLRAELRTYPVAERDPRPAGSFFMARPES